MIRIYNVNTTRQDAGRSMFNSGIQLCTSASATLSPSGRSASLKQEQTARALLQEAIAHCESVAGYVSRELFEEILESEEEHIDWLETRLDLIERAGEQNYLQSQMGEVLFS